MYHVLSECRVHIPTKQYIPSFPFVCFLPRGSPGFGLVLGWEEGLVTGPGPEASIETCHSGLTSFPECTGFVSSRSCPGGCRRHPHFIRGDTEAQRGTEPSVICRTQSWSAGMALRSFGSLCPSPAGEASRARGAGHGAGARDAKIREGEDHCSWLHRAAQLPPTPQAGSPSSAPSGSLGAPRGNHSRCLQACTQRSLPPCQLQRD